MQRLRKNTRRGFTLVELLVVVLILSILMSVALPLYLSAVTDSQKKVCRANMQTIADTVVAGKVKLGYADFTVWIGNSVSTLITSSPDKLPDLTVAPVCPNAGTYTIVQGNTGNNTTFKVNCSVALHGTFQPGVDSN
jgi:type IV pilus assembly protein PilA